MTQVRLHAFVSLDGFVADRDGDTEWLVRYQSGDYGFDTFMESIGAVVMGRRTFQALCAFGDWPYEEQNAFILSSESLLNLPKRVVYTDKGIQAAVQAARESTGRDVWIVGGAVTMQSALDAGLVDIVELFVSPILLGEGLTLFNTLESRHALVFDGIQTCPEGVVKLRYLTREL